MPEQKKPQGRKDEAIQDLPNKPVTPNAASVVKGGRSIREIEPEEEDTGQV